MLQHAIMGHSRLVADDREIRRAGASFMVDTLASLGLSEQTRAKVAVVTGSLSDSLNNRFLCSSGGSICEFFSVSFVLSLIAGAVWSSVTWQQTRTQ